MYSFNCPPHSFMVVRVLEDISFSAQDEVKQATDECWETICHTKECLYDYPRSAVRSRGRTQHRHDTENMRSRGSWHITDTTWTSWKSTVTSHCSVWNGQNGGGVIKQSKGKEVNLWMLGDWCENHFYWLFKLFSTTNWQEIWRKS